MGENNIISEKIDHKFIIVNEYMKKLDATSYIIEKTSSKKILIIANARDTVMNIYEHLKEFDFIAARGITYSLSNDTTEVRYIYI
ncbi:MAG: hypothetical protein EOP34_04805 [Rickettsiales bacterium]|nr:MAG: hypothetical protein EOP34_04805 [Rickettsiales bacterium]